ncbi:NAD-dependent dehydratase [Pseudomonas fluorescens]|uniref:NAD-dependent dehydratase n=1 Tax=Pseudomonas fluorescens TaxID=294 RepID=A0A1T2Y2U9_PSEFL|nr:SDR family oxidoreductase [Pseudomonas fluorescens]OPA86342.1 NAD-dependent dehydratase [Pseudomonas fluorescens]
MRIFVTGANGFIGSRVVSELLADGYQVTGLVRSDASAQALEAKGAQAQRGTLEDPQAWVNALEHCDGVIHTAFDHDFNHFVANCEKDRRVISAMGAVLEGSQRPLIITSATGMGHNGDDDLAREAIFNAAHPHPRVASELEGNRQLDAGIDVRVVRLPQVHDTVRQGLITYYVALAREKGVAAYINDGANCFSAAHVSDVAKLYVSVLENGERGARYNAVAEQGVSARQIAEVVAEGLGVSTTSLQPEASAAHFGWFAMFAAVDLRASSEWTRHQLNWQPNAPGLLDDLRAMDYSNVAAHG